MCSLYDRRHLPRELRPSVTLTNPLRYKRQRRASERSAHTHTHTHTWSRTSISLFCEEAIFLARARACPARAFISCFCRALRVSSAASRYFFFKCSTMGFVLFRFFGGWGWTCGVGNGRCDEVIEVFGLFNRCWVPEGSSFWCSFGELRWIDHFQK